MTKDLGDSGTVSTNPGQNGPDYFAFYTQELQMLLSLDNNSLSFSTSKDCEDNVEKDCGDEKNLVGEENSSTVTGCFSKGIGGKLSDFKKERVKSLLKMAVASLTQEVDDMLDPVLAIRRLQSQLRSKKSLINHSAAASEGDVSEHPRKKIRLSSSFPSQSDDENEIVNDDKRCCCQSTGITIERTDQKGSKPLCDLCGLEYKQEKFPVSVDDQNTGSYPGSNMEAYTKSKEVDNNLQFLLDKNTASVESSIKKNADELFMTLEHMEQQLEGLLDLSQSSNRLMTPTEKQHLHKLIQKLPPRNLDRVVEIIQKNKQLGNQSTDEIHVNLEEQDNVTLWRLYIYVKAVENAKKLASS